jgi:hypothetical protein
MEEHLRRADGADYFGSCPHCGKTIATSTSVGACA